MAAGLCALRFPCCCEMKWLAPAGAVLPVNVVREDGDGDRAFGSFLEERAFGFLLLVGGVGISELHCAFAENLEAVVEVSAGGERLSAEAGAGVADLNELDGLRS